MQKKRRYKDFATPQEYLENVLNTWTEFCYVNCGLAQAISDLLQINSSLASTIKVLANELKIQEQKENR